MITPPGSARFVSVALFIAVCGGCDKGSTEKTTPTITWAQPAAITYGTSLGSTQLDATASVPGTFAYSPAASTVPGAGTQTLSVTFTPADTSRYNTSTASVSLTVDKATPTLSWPAPGPISSGIPLSATQLNATASVAGSFTYTPAATTVLSAGTQTLSVTFTPTDTADYTTAAASVSLTVSPPSGIGPGGGTVSGFYGASVTVPSGALSGSVDIQILRDSTGAPTLPSSGIDVAGAVYALIPHGTSFAAPATVQVPFDSGRIPTDATPVIYKAEPGGAFAAIATVINGDMLSADVSNFSWVVPGFASTLPRMVYAFTQDASGVSISSFKIDRTTGAMTGPTSTAPVGTGALSITVHPSRRFLYVTNSGSGARGTASNVPANSLSVYQLDPVTGAVTGPTDTQPVNGNPVSVVVHPTGKFVYVVNEVRFGSPIGNLSAFSIDKATGALTSLGTTADSAGAPATALAFAPSGEFAYVTYLHGTSTPVGNTLWDHVVTYSVSPTSGLFSSNPLGAASTGDNPWAMVVTPGGQFGYVASLGTQGSVNQLSIYKIDQTSGVMALRASFSISSGAGQVPSSLAMDPKGRFLYVGTQSPVFVPPSSNFNVQVFGIDPSSGGLTFSSGAATGSNPQGPISVVAEPQAQFVYVLDGNSTLEPFQVGSNGTLTASGTPLNGILLGGATGGVGDPFFFAASGTSPVWEDHCTLIAEGGPYAYLDACQTLHMSSGPGSNSGSNGGGGTVPQQPPPASFTLQVLVDAAYGGSVTSSPAGIDYNPVSGQNFFAHAFPKGSSVTLTAAPPDTSQGYDVKWTGTCSGDSLTTTVTMSQDQHCYVAFTPTSLR